MAKWALLLMETPFNTVTGTTGLITPLSLASGASPSFAVDDIDSVSFSLPGGHYHAALITEGANDIILTREDVVLQRYRVVSKSISNDGGKHTVQITASSYKEYYNNQLLHDGDVLNYPFLTGDSADDAAWKILNEGQTKSTTRNINLSRGLMPVVAIADHVGYVNDDSTSTFFTPGQTRMEAVNTILQVDDGCDWSIDPDPANPYTAIKFNVWNRGARYNSTFTGGLSTILLSSASMASYSVDKTPRKNVIRASGLADETGPSVVNWRPVSQNPDIALYIGAGSWETSVSTDMPNSTQVSKFADEQYDIEISGLDEWQCTLHPGEWSGPADLWIGDSARMVLQVPTVDDDGNRTQYMLLDVDQVMRVMSLSVNVGTPETVSLTLNRTSLSLLDQIYETRDDLKALQRRT